MTKPGPGNLDYRPVRLGQNNIGKGSAKELPGSILLDGDELREALGSANHGFDVESRKKLAKTYARLAGLLARQGFYCACGDHFTFHDLHAWNRKNLPNYLGSIPGCAGRRTPQARPEKDYMPPMCRIWPASRPKPNFPNSLIYGWMAARALGRLLRLRHEIFFA